MKMLTILLAAAMLLSLCACSTQAPEETQPVILQSATGSTTVEGVEIGLAGIRRTAGDTVLQITWKNNTPYQVLYGDVFWLQIQKDGQWESLNVNENTAFHTVGYMLQPRTTANKNYTTSWLYGTLQPGTYRFLTNCTVYETEEGRTCDLYVEFTLGTLPSETGTDPNAKSPYSAPPALILRIGNDAKEFAATGYTWNYATGDGKMTASYTGLQEAQKIKDALTMLETTQTEATIDFEEWPDDLTIRCWPDSLFGSPDSDSEAVMTWNNNRFTLKPAISGGYIYEITARWDDDGGLYHGTATYYLYITSYPVMPIQPRN